MSDRAQRIVLWCLAVLLVVGTGLALRYARGYRPLVGLTPTDASALPGDVTLRFEGIKVVGRSNNQPAWRLTADRIDTTRSRSRLDFSGNIEASLLQSGKARAIFTAPFATFDANARALQATGNLLCRVRSPKRLNDTKNELRIETSLLNWIVGSDLILCPGIVRATLPGVEVKGQQFQVDLRTRKYSLKNVTASFVVEEDNIEGTLQRLEEFTPR